LLKLGNGIKVGLFAMLRISAIGSRPACPFGKLRVTPVVPLKPEILRLAALAQDFACKLPLGLRLVSRLQIGSKCNEALSRDLWPLDPFESAPMRATSSGMGYCIPCAIPLLLEIKELAE
jgi:hypothetical protein